MSVRRCILGGIALSSMALAALSSASEPVPAGTPPPAVLAASPRQAVPPPDRQAVHVIARRTATNRVVIGGRFTPARQDRTVALQVHRTSWHTVSTRHQDPRGRVRFTARASQDGDSNLYRLRARRQGGLSAVTSDRVDAAPWLTVHDDAPDSSGVHDVVALPAQPAGLAYDSAADALPYAEPGGLVVAGRDNFGDRAFEHVSQAGGTVLLYLDPVIDNEAGRYHRLLNASSLCGPRTARWPGSHRANEWGHLNDFRPGSVLQRKLECVLETMVAENPHMGGWFADDVGSRSWFPDVDWRAFPNKQAYRAGAVALTHTFRRVADRHGLVFLVNGTWSAGDGGGYPDPDIHGNALADGAVVEHHDGEIDYFGPYGCSDQWAADSPVTRGTAFHLALTSTSAGLVEYVDSGCYAYVNERSGFDTLPPWGSPHPTGLPSRVGDPSRASAG